MHPFRHGYFVGLGYPAKISGNCLEGNPLRLAGDTQLLAGPWGFNPLGLVDVPLITQGIHWLQTNFVSKKNS